MYIDNKLLSWYSKKIKEYNSFLKESDDIFKSYKINIEELPSSAKETWDTELLSLAEEYIQIKKQLLQTESIYNNLVKKIKTYD